MWDPRRVVHSTRSFQSEKKYVRCHAAHSTCQALIFPHLVLWLGLGHPPARPAAHSRAAKCGWGGAARGREWPAYGWADGTRVVMFKRWPSHMFTMSAPLGIGCYFSITCIRWSRGVTSSYSFIHEYINFVDQNNMSPKGVLLTNMCLTTNTRRPIFAL